MLLLDQLRIGNIIQYKGRLVHVTSLSMDVDDEYEETIGFCYLGTLSNEVGGRVRNLIEKLEHVALTPDRLAACGFEKNDAGFFQLDITASLPVPQFQILYYSPDTGVISVVQNNKSPIFLPPILSLH